MASIGKIHQQHAFKIKCVPNRRLSFAMCPRRLASDMPNGPFVVHSLMQLKNFLDRIKRPTFWDSLNRIKLKGVNQQRSLPLAGLRLPFLRWSLLKENTKLREEDGSARVITRGFKTHENAHFSYCTVKPKDLWPKNYSMRKWKSSGLHVCICSSVI
jgi:hypothetical protein